MYWFFFRESAAPVVFHACGVLVEEVLAVGPVFVSVGVGEFFYFVSDVSSDVLEVKYCVFCEGFCDDAASFVLCFCGCQLVAAFADEFAGCVAGQGEEVHLRLRMSAPMIASSGRQAQTGDFVGAGGTVAAVAGCASVAAGVVVPRGVRVAAMLVVAMFFGLTAAMVV